MKFSTKLTVFLLAIAAVMAYVGYRDGQPSHVESVFLTMAERAGQNPTAPEKPVDMLQEVMRLSTHELTEQAYEASVNDETADKLIEEYNFQLNNTFRLVRSDRSITDYKPGTDAATLVHDILARDLSERPMGEYAFASVLALLACVIYLFTHMEIRRRNRERIIHSLFLVTACSSILVLFLIMVFLFIEGLPVFQHVAPLDFLFGDEWYPTEDPPALEIFPLIVGSFAVTLVSSAMAIPLGVMTAIYVAEIAPPKVRGIVKPTVEMLAALPSVVIGFFGMVVVAPFLQNFFGIATGLNLFNAAIMLAFMSVPTITSISEDAIYTVPQELKEASLALGATHWQSIARVILPASLSGITTAVILGMARAIGETMVVLMVAGGAAMLPTSLFDPIRPMPASIAAEMAEAPFHSEHYYALFAIGMVLFLFTLLFNMIADHVSHKYKQTGSATL